MAYNIRGVYVLLVALFISLFVILLKLSSLEVQSKDSHLTLETVTQEDLFEDETDLGKDVLRMPKAHTQNLNGFDQSPASVDLSEAREKYQLMLRVSVPHILQVPCILKQWGLVRI